MSRTTRMLATVALLALPWACGPQQEQEASDVTPAAAEPPPYETTPVAEGVWQFRWQGHNALFVETAEGTVVVDPISTEAAATFAEEIRATVGDQPLLAVVYSHRDADHATGAEVIRAALGPDAPVVAHENALAPLQQAANPDLPPPDVTYEDEMTLAESSRPVVLSHPGPSHSDDQSVVLIPDVGVAFAVDFVSLDRVGYQELPGWHMPGQLEAIQHLLGLEFDTIVFGHGPIGDKAAIERQLAYYEALAESVRRAIADGLTEDEAAETVHLEDFASWGQYDEWFSMNVRGMYRLLSEG